MYRILLFTILAILLVRAFSRLWTGIVTGIGGGSAPGSQHIPQRGVQMVRDPVCGTFVVPGQSLTVQSGRDVLHFCSLACRDHYLAHGASRTGSAQGRTA